jgi:hypothetical protein
MKHLIMSLLLLTGVAANAQESILDLAEGYEYELSIPFPGDTIVHIDYVDLPTEMRLSAPHRTVEDLNGISNIYYFKQWRISYHVWYGRRETTTISRL